MNHTSIPAQVGIAVGGMLAAHGACAAELELSVEIPQLNVAEYHRPYLAIWIEGADGQAATSLAVWYQDKDTKEGHGTKWLPDLRQWWRKSGRSLQLPADGISGPTRPAGRHQLKFDARRLAALKPGQYSLVIEAVREVGGRELLKIPFAWPAKAPQTGKARGTSELGAITLNVKP